MRSQKFILIAGTGVAALLLGSLPLVTGGTRFEWVGVPFLAPGIFAAALIFQDAVHSRYPMLYLGLAEVLNFAFLWIALYVALQVFKKFILRRGEQA